MDSLEQWKKIWAGFSIGQKLSISIILAIVIGGLVALTIFVKSDTYEILYANLDDQNAGEIVAKLRNDNIPFKLANGGKTVLVPKDKVYETRLQLAMQNLPGGSVGFELFDKPNFGISDFVQGLNFQRALQGELSRTITQLETVEQARVHIVLPHESAFIEQEKEPTASVVLKVRGGAVLGKKQIQGIIHLVASSVEGLKPGNVTVVDSRGEVLSMGMEDNSVAALTGNQYEMVQNVEKYFENKTQSMLDKMLGPQRAVVRITADLNFEQIKTEKETYDPEGIIRSEQSTSINSSGGASEDEESGGGTYTKDDTVNNYEIGKTVQQIVSEVGDVKKLSIAVVVDGKYEPKPDNPEEKTFVPRTDDEIQKYTELIRDAISFNEARGDQIKVQCIPFDTTYKDELKKELADSDKLLKDKQKMDFIMSSLQKGIKIIIPILVIFLVLKKLSGIKPDLLSIVNSPAAASPSAPNGNTGPAAKPIAQNTSTAAAASDKGNESADKLADTLKKTWLSS